MTITTLSGTVTLNLHNSGLKGSLTENQRNAILEKSGGFWVQMEKEWYLTGTFIKPKAILKMIEKQEIVL